MVQADDRRNQIRTIRQFNQAVTNISAEFQRRLSAIGALQAIAEEMSHQEIADYCYLKTQSELATEVNASLPFQGLSKRFYKTAHRAGYSTEQIAREFCASFRTFGIPFGAGEKVFKGKR